MTPADILALLQTAFGLITKPDALDPFALVGPHQLRDVCTFLKDDPRLRFDFLNDITATDWLEPDPKKIAKAGFDPHLEVVYHLSSFAHPGRRLTLKVVLPRDGAELPSVAALWPTADWHEREAFDLLGVRFAGHPNLVRILLADDWIGHPLRKDYEYPLEYRGIRCR